MRIRWMFMILLMIPLVAADFEGWIEIPGTDIGDGSTLKIRPDHPRILITDDNLPEIRCKVGVYDDINPLFLTQAECEAEYGPDFTGSLKDLWLSLKDDVDANFDDGANYMHYAGLVRQIIQDDSYCDVFKNYLDGLSAPLSSTGGLSTSQTGTLSKFPLAYDWCYDLIEQDEYMKFLSVFYVESLKDPFTWYERPSYYQFNYANVLVDDEHLDDLNPAYKQNIIDQVAFVYNEYTQNYIPVTNEIACDGAVDHYSSKYGTCMAEADIIYSQLSNFVDMKGISDFTRNFGNFIIHRKRGGDNLPIPLLGKYIQPEFSGGGHSSLYGSRHDDPNHQYLANEFLTNQGSGMSILEKLKYIVWYDPQKSQEPLSDIDELEFHGECSGMHFMRDSWEEETAIHSSFFAPAVNSGGMAYNHFTISRGKDPLLTRSNAYIGNDLSMSFFSYNEKTVGFNSIIILDKDYDGAGDFYIGASYCDPARPDIERKHKVGDVWVGDYWCENNRMPLLNDGSQDSSGCSLDIGSSRWPSYNDKYCGFSEKYESTEDYSYVEGDASYAYGPTDSEDKRIDSAVRSFVYIKPDIFVVFDRIKGGNTDQKKQSLLHMVERPSVDGSLSVVKGQLSTGGVFTSQDSSLITVKYGDSALLNQILLPEEPSIDIIGGRNSENLPLQHNLFQSPFEDGTYGHRMDLVDNNNLDDPSFEMYVEGYAQGSDVFQGFNFPFTNTMYCCDSTCGSDYSCDCVDNPGKNWWELDENKKWGFSTQSTSYFKAPTEPGVWRTAVYSQVEQEDQNFLSVLQVMKGDIVLDDLEAELGDTYTLWSDSAVNLTGDSDRVFGLYRNHAYAPRNMDTVWARWNFDILDEGNYEIFAFIPVANPSYMNLGIVSYEIESTQGVETVEIDQSEARAEWISLGLHHMSPGERGVTVRATGRPVQDDNKIVVDAVKLVYMDEQLDMVDTVLVDGDTMQGALIDGDTADEKWVVMFGKTGPDVTDAVFDVPAEGEFTFLFTDLVPEAGYDISVDGQTVTLSPGSGYLASDQGTIYTLLLLEGSPIQISELSLESTEESIGVAATYDGVISDDATAYIEFKEQGESYWRRGFDLLKSTIEPYNRFIGSVMFLDKGTGYDVRVTISDPVHGISYAEEQVTTKDYQWPADQGTQYYVAAGTEGVYCSDSWSGTSIEQAFCTIQHAADTVSPGDTINILPGVYYQRVDFGVSGVEGLPITVRGIGDGVIIDGSDPDLLERDDWVERPDIGEGIYSLELNLNSGEEPRLIVVDDHERLFHSYDEDFEQGWDHFLNGWDFTDAYIHPGVVDHGWIYDPDISTLFVKIPEEMGSPDPADHVMHINTYYDDAAQSAFKLYYDQWINIENLNFRYVRNGVFLSRARHNRVAENSFEHFILGVASNKGSSYNTIEGNYFYDTNLFEMPWNVGKVGRQETASISGPANSADDQGNRGTGNIIRNNIIDGSTNGIGAYSFNTDVYDNQISHILDDSFEIDTMYFGPSENVRYWNNRADTVFDGVSFSPTHGLTYFIGNTITNFESYPVKIKSTQQSIGPVLFWHNTLWSDYENPNGRDVVGVSPTNQQFLNFYFKNNIIHTPQEVVDGDYDDHTTTDSFFDNDLLWSISDDVFFKWNAVPYADIQELRDATGYEMDGIEADPLLVNPHSGSSIINADSPAIDTAILIPGLHCVNSDEADPSQVYCMHWSGEGPDIGAYEYYEEGYLPGDSNQDGQVDDAELQAFILEWLRGDVSLRRLLECIAAWKEGIP